MPYTFTTRGWAACNGQLLPIAQNAALYSLLGAQYGGDGRTTFGLPNLNGRAALGQGQGPGLQNYPLGTATGTESVALLGPELPAHTHALSGAVPVSTAGGGQAAPGGGYFAQAPTEQYGQGVNPAGNMAPLLNGTTGAAGGTQAHENRMPFLALNYCIALLGIYPLRP